MSAETLTEKILPLETGVGLPYLEEDLETISIYPVLDKGNNAFTFFLQQTCPQEEPNLAAYLERSTICLQLSLQLPGTATARQVIRRQSILQVVASEKNQNRILFETSFAGSQTAILFALDKQWSYSALEATKLRTSGLRIRVQSTVFLAGTGHQYTLNSQLPLEELLRLSNNFTVQFKYFDLRFNTYRDMPVTVSGNLHARDMAAEPRATITDGRISNANFSSLPITKFPILSAKLNSQFAYDPKIRLHLVDDWVIPTTGQETLYDYPIITDDSTSYWINRKNSKDVLVLPEPALIVPGLQTPPADAPFQFRFHSTGLLDTNGKPVLEGELILTLESSPSATLISNAQTAYPGNTISPLTLDQVDYLLQIPYADQNNQPQALQINPAEITTANGQTRLLFRLLNTAIRLCYAVISGTTATLSLEVAMAFKGYSRLDPQLLQLSTIIGTKIAATTLNRGFQPLMAARLHPAVSAYTPHTTALQPVVLAQLITPEVQYKMQRYVRSISLPVNFPCTRFGQFFQEDNNGVSTAIGCKEAYKLGETPPSWYTPLTDLNTPQYTVYRSTNVPNEFLVIPVQYIIGRQLSKENQQDIFKPTIILYSTIDAVGGKSKWVLDCTLLPDISVSMRYELEQACAKLTPYTPVIQYLTELSAGTTTTVLSMDQMTGTTTRTYPFGKMIRLTIETDLSSILILLDMLKHNALNGVLTTTLPGNEQYSTNLLPGLQRIGGEWTQGHCTIVNTNTGKLTITNKTECRLQFSSIKALQANDPVDLELVAELPPFTQQEESLPEGVYTGFIPYYTVIDPPQVDLEQLNNYIEDVHCQLIFLTTIDFDQLQLAGIEISYRLQGTTAASTVQLSRQQTNLEVTLQMPITNFLMERVIEYKVNKLIRSDQTVTVQDNLFQTQDLSNQGNLIYINL